jgi:hypothetical protein
VPLLPSLMDAEAIETVGVGATSLSAMEPVAPAGVPTV